MRKIIIGYHLSRKVCRINLPPNNLYFYKTFLPLTIHTFLRHRQQLNSLHEKTDNNPSKADLTKVMQRKMEVFGIITTAINLFLFYFIPLRHKAISPVENTRQQIQSTWRKASAMDAFPFHSHLQLNKKQHHRGYRVMLCSTCSFVYQLNCFR